MGKGRAPCCDKSKVKRGPWSAAEDSQLISFIQRHGHENWRALPKQAGLLRCGKSCRLRWINYLRPDVKRGNFTAEEEDTIIRLRAAIGNKWSKIAASLPGRTDNEIKNVWNTHLKKRVACGSGGGDVHGKLHQQSPLSSSSSSMGKRRYAPKKPRQTHESSPCSSNIASNSTQADASAGLEGQMGSSTLELGSVGLNNLEEVNKPETTTTSVSDPFEYDFDFWSMLGNFGTSQSNETDARQISSSSFGAATVDRGREAGDSRKWFQDLETEFGFPEPTGDNNNN